MTGPAIAIGPGDFAALFPFHLACDDHFVVVQVGPSLGKLCPGLAPGTRFGDHFRIRRPDVGLDLAAMVRNRDILFVLEHTGSPLVLRAQVLPVPQQGLIAFLGSPWLQDPTELGKLGLSLTDFALHDATADLLQVVQASVVALRDTRKLADKLAQQRAQLREANEALRASETRFRDLSEQSPLGVLTVGLDGQVTFVNRRLVSALGGTEQQVLGNAWKELFPPEGVAQIQALLMSLAPGDEPVNLVLPLRRPDGSEGWVSITARASEDNAGRPTGFTCVTEDITARKAAEQALARARDLELEISARVQEALLHGQPPRGFPGLEVGEFAASSRGVNGDFYDFYIQNDRVVDVILGDAMGKGLPAALLGAATKARFARVMARLVYEAGGALPEPVEIVARVQRSLGPQLIAMESFTTLVYLRLDFGSRMMTWVDCGHPGILHLQGGSAQVRVLKGDNAPLGFAGTQVFSQEQRPFGPGDQFAVFSDGLTEVTGETGEMFGVERLAAVLAATAGQSAAAAAQAIRSAVAAFAGPGGAKDDMSCLVIGIGRERIAGPDCAGRTLPVAKAALPEVREFLSQFLRTAVPAGLPGDWLDRLLVAAHEAAANAVHHGATGPTMDVAVGTTDAGVQIHLTYDGSPFGPPAAVALPDLETFPERGFGLALIEAGTDSVAYGTDANGRRTITLTKFYPPRENAPVR